MNLYLVKKQVFFIAHVASTQAQQTGTQTTVSILCYVAKNKLENDT